MHWDSCGKAWGSIMPNEKAGFPAPGKTTTTSMCTHIAMAARVDPTVMIGSPSILTGHRVDRSLRVL